MDPMDTAEDDRANAPQLPPRRIEVSLTQLVAGSAAAVCGAWLASRIGVAGTVIGAGLVSALVTVLSAVYAHGARQARDRLQQRLEAIRARGPLPASYAADTPGADPAHPGAAATGADTDALTQSRALLLPPFDLEDSRGYRWGRIALAALAVFVLGMGVVTVVELVAGHSLACTAAGIGCQGTTTLPIPGRPQPTATPARRPSSTPAPSAAGSASTPGQSPTTSPTPTGSATGTGSPSPSVSQSPSVSPSPSPSATAAPSPTG
jgi:hypothetical protein